jgi:hypothetical protein
LPLRAGAAEPIDDVAVQLSHGHREEIGLAVGGANLQRRSLLCPQHFGAPGRREEARALQAPGETAADIDVAQFGRSLADRR